MSQIKVNSIVPAGGLPAGANGGIIQVVQTVKSDTFTHTGNTSVTDVTGLNVTITPSSSSSKVLLLCFMNISNNNISRVQFVRGTTAIGIPSAAGSRPVGTASMNNGGDSNVCDPLTMIFLDSPATTSATTYKVQWSIEGSGGSSTTGYLNRRGCDQSYGLVSSITLYEVTA